MNKKTLYLGTDPSNYKTENELIHYPVIKIVPCDLNALTYFLEKWDTYTHLIFTSKNAVKICETFNLDYKNKVVIAIGKITAGALEKGGNVVSWIPQYETQEGLIELLESKDLSNAQVFFPRSSLSRSCLVDFFQKKQIAFDALDLYETRFQNINPLPNLDEIGEIIFTSPSTVHAFFRIFPPLNKDIKLTAIGPITESVLVKNL